MVRVRGGGSTGQAQAVRHGIARALQSYEPALRPALKAPGGSLLLLLLLGGGGRCLRPLRPKDACLGQSRELS